MKEHVIPKEKHGIEVDQVDHHAVEIIQRLQDAGYVAYLVGGGVRDLLLGHVPKDFDISTSAEPEEIKALFRNCLLIGRRFRLAHIRFGKKVFEVSTFRAGDPEAEELIVRDNVWGDPEEDAKRRDFTINGLFYDPTSETVIDYVNGFADVEKKVLRSIGQPYRRFKQDPVRMLRLLKFEARFGLKVLRDEQIALAECRHEIVKSSQARVFEELLRMLESGAACPFLELINEHGLLEHLLPEVSHFIEQYEEGDDIFDFLEEIDRIVLDPTEKSLDRAVLLSCFSYPLLNHLLQVHYLERSHVPHLGLINEQVRDVIHGVFDGFFNVPRRIKISMMNVLNGQYRLTPLHKRKNQRKRIPHGCEFHFALDFLKLRCCLEPGLQSIYEDWRETYEKSGLKEEAQARPRKRKRPRSRKKTNDSRS